MPCPIFLRVARRCERCLRFFSQPLIHLEYIADVHSLHPAICISKWLVLGELGGLHDCSLKVGCCMHVAECCCGGQPPRPCLCIMHDVDMGCLTWDALHTAILRCCGDDACIFILCLDTCARRGWYRGICKVDNWEGRLGLACFV